MAGCEDDNAPLNTSDRQTGRLNIYMTDSPASFDSVNITFSRISAHIDSQWISVQGDPVKINLLEWNNGRSILIGSAEMPAGHYTQIRLMIDAAEIVVDGQHFPLTVPSGAQTGLKMGPEFTILAGSTYELVIDFDVERSIVINGPRHNPYSYKLKPHLRCIPRAVTGAIGGTVTNPEHLPTAYAIQGTDTISSAMADTLSGFFMLSYLVEGHYTVSVRDTFDQSFQEENIPVTVGQMYDLGQITLQ